MLVSILKTVQASFIYFLPFILSGNEFKKTPSALRDP